MGHESRRLEERRYKTLEEIAATIKAHKKPKKVKAKKGLKKTHLRSKRNRVVQDLINKAD